MKRFELKTWLSENREQVLNSFKSLTEERFYNGITQRNFMITVMNRMSQNNPRSAKKASSLLPTILGEVVFNNSKVEGEDKVTNALRNKYEGTSYMAMV